MAGTTDPAAAGAAATQLPNIWCIRADNGKYTDLLVREGCIGYGGCDWPDLNPCQTRADIFAQLEPLPRFQAKSKQVISAYAGMMARFLWQIKPDDWVITPEKGGQILRYGKITEGDCWHELNAPDGCHYTMRRKIAWEPQPLRRDSLPGDLQKTLKHAAKTVFAVKHCNAFLTAIGNN